jgi:hypothetical protein
MIAICASGTGCNRISKVFSDANMLSVSFSPGLSVPRTMARRISVITDAAGRRTGATPAGRDHYPHRIA